MRKLVSILLAFCMCLSIGVVFAGCDKTPPSVTYTVTEAEWKTNLNLTKGQQQPQTLSYGVQSFASQPLTEITSYTVFAEGINAGIPGSALLKMAPNGMFVEFYVNGTFKESESGVFDNTNVLYQSVKINMMMLVPFADSYSQFTFDDTKNAYVAQNITSILVDDYDINNTETIYHKTAEVSFINGYLNTVSFEMTDINFTETVATFTFTFSNINNTTVQG